MNVNAVSISMTDRVLLMLGNKQIETEISEEVKHITSKFGVPGIDN